jgi:hypothetical protein
VPVHLAAWCEVDERKDGLFIRFTDAFAGRWVLILCWGLFAGQYIQLGFWHLVMWEVIPDASVIAFAEWLADMSWWFERILLK